MIRCVVVLRRVIGPIGGKWIAYTAAQVARRRAAQMVVVVVCTVVAPGDAAAPRPAAAPAPIWPAVAPPLLLVPHQAPEPPRVVRIAEPPSFAIMAVGLVALWWVRRRA